MGLVPVLAPTMKEQILLTAERLFAERGLDGVSLRQIGGAVGNGNNSAVQYHFGSKNNLVQAIVEHRMPPITERRLLLASVRQPDDVRSWIECHLLPLMEQGEQEHNHYLGFMAMLQERGRRTLYGHVDTAHLVPIRTFYERMQGLLPAVPEPLRTHRVAEASRLCIHSSSDRQVARDHGLPVLPFAAHVNELVGGLVSFLEAPVLPATLTAVEEAHLTGSFGPTPKGPAILV